MSRKTLLSELSDDEKKQIDTELYKAIEPVVKNKFQKQLYNKKTEYIQLYSQTDNLKHIIVPFAYTSIPSIKRQGLTSFPKVTYTFKGALREKQLEVVDTTIQNLQKSGSFIISTATAFGKSITSIYLACCIGLKVLIIVNRILLLEQWKKEFERWTHQSRVKIITTSDFDLTNCDVCIINAINIIKFPETFFDQFGFVVVDEIHQIMSKVISSCMSRLFPRYMLGLSATPYRSDGLNFLFDLYFGVEKVFIALFQKHIVYPLRTGFEPEVLRGSDGKIIWDSVLSGQATDIERNEKIIKVVKYFSTRKIMVLTKRVAHAKYLINRLTEEKETVTSLIQSEKKFDKQSRILVGNASKCGTGFDHADLDMLILAMDLVEYFVQYLGRVFRTQTVIPIIIDVIDLNSTLERHYKERKKTYVDCGGEIRSLEDDHPNLLL